MKTWNIDEMLFEQPCEEYRNRALLERLWDGRERVSILDVLRLEIPAEDRLWVATLPDALEPAVQFRWLEGIVARAINRALEVYDDPQFITWASRWLDGTDRNAAAARAAARAAAHAARAAGWTAAYAAYAAAYAAGAAAYAAGAAAYAAAYAAGAAEAAEREQQVADLVTILEDEL